MKIHAAPRPSERVIVRIPIRDIRTSPYQPRRMFSESSIAELAESIRIYGLLTPLWVRRIGTNQYELIAGERRLRALLLLSEPYADAIVLSAYDTDCALLALIENVQRENLHYLDEAEAYKRILEEHPITQEKLAHSLSCSPSALANRLRLLKLSEAVRRMLRESGLSERHARALLRVKDADVQLQYIQEAASGHWSVNQLEAHIARQLGDKKPPAKQHISRIFRDNRIVINAVLDTVKELNRIGVQASSRIEEHEDNVQVIVTIHTAQTGKSIPV